MTNYQSTEMERELDERVIEINRVAKVVKGGRRFSFRVTVVVGDNSGSVGMGIGKANSVPDAMRKATEKARKNMHRVNLYSGTIPHEVLGKVSGAKVTKTTTNPRTGRTTKTTKVGGKATNPRTGKTTTVKGGSKKVTNPKTGKSTTVKGGVKKTKNPKTGKTTTTKKGSVKRKKKN